MKRQWQASETAMSRALLLLTTVAVLTVNGISSASATEPQVVHSAQRTVRVETEDAACRSLQGIFDRFDKLTDAINGRGDYSGTLPPPGPECVDIPSGSQLEATGDRSAYRMGDEDLWLVEVEYRGERRWIMESALRR